jgi:hypothetical protein
VPPPGGYLDIHDSGGLVLFYLNVEVPVADPDVLPDLELPLKEALKQQVTEAVVVSSASREAEASLTSFLIRASSVGQRRYISTGAAISRRPAPAFIHLPMGELYTSMLYTGVAARLP